MPIFYSLWYHLYMDYAIANELMIGYGDKLFGPDDPITCEQLAAMLDRYADDRATDGGLSAFTDADGVSDWAVDTMPSRGQRHQCVLSSS